LRDSGLRDSTLWGGRRIIVTERVVEKVRVGLSRRGQSGWRQSGWRLYGGVRGGLGFEFRLGCGLRFRRGELSGGRRRQFELGLPDGTVRGGIDLGGGYDGRVTRWRSQLHPCAVGRAVRRCRGQSLDRGGLDRGASTCGDRCLRDAARGGRLGLGRPRGRCELLAGSPQELIGCSGLGRCRAIRIACRSALIFGDRPELSAGGGG
jgi:hypothetical protein